MEPLLKANCEECPLARNGRAGTPVLASTCKKPPVRFAIVGEGPGRDEEKLGQPFVGRTGSFLNDVLELHKIDRESLHLTYAVLCRPRKELSEGEWLRAIECCKPRLNEELTDLSPRRFVLALGGKALQALTGNAHISRWWGSPIEVGRRVIFPLLHPSFLLTRKPELLPVFLRGFSRALEFFKTEKKWEWPEIITEEGPRMLSALKQMEGAKSVGVDVETHGINPYRDPLLCLGLATDDCAISVRWTPGRKPIEYMVRKILGDKSIQKVLQNGNYDAVSLRTHGLPLEGYTFDTMVAHHVVAPLLPHNLSFIAAAELPAPRWKEEFKVYDDRKGSEAFVTEKQNPSKFREMLRYNAKDALITHLLRGTLLKQIKKVRGGTDQLKLLMKLNHLGLQMKDWGVGVDSDVQEGHRTRLKKEIDIIAAKLLQRIGPREKFNLNSNKDLRKLFFNEYGVTPTRTSVKTGDPTLDKEMLEQVATHEEGDAKEIAIGLLQYRMWTKDLSTYVNGLKLHEDKRIHPNWRPGLLITHRWSSNNPNMQNITKPVYKGENLVRPGLRDMFVPRPGNVFVEADYSQLELRIIALLSGDQPLIQAYNEGRDVHALNAETLGCSRKIAKTFVYLTNYKGSPRKGARGMVAAGYHTFTTELFKALQDKWFSMHSAIHDYQDRLVKDTKREGYLEMPLTGRRIYFYLGQIKPTEVCNYPIQGTAADIMNKVTLKVAEQVDWKESALVIQAHDALVLEGPDKQKLADILQTTMTTDITVEGRTMTLPVDVSFGANWGNMNEA